MTEEQMQVVSSIQRTIKHLEDLVREGVQIGVDVTLEIATLPREFGGYPLKAGKIEATFQFRPYNPKTEKPFA